MIHPAHISYTGPWSTADECVFLSHIGTWRGPGSGRKSGRRQDLLAPERITLLQGYLAGMLLRTHWVGLNMFEIEKHIKTLLEDLEKLEPNSVLNEEGVPAHEAV